MFSVATREVELIYVNVVSLKGGFRLAVEVTHAEKPILLALKNPKIGHILNVALTCSE